MVKTLIKITPENKKALTKFYDIMANKSFPITLNADTHLNPKINEFNEIILSGRKKFVLNNKPVELDNELFLADLNRGQKLLKEIYLSVKDRLNQEEIENIHENLISMRDAVIVIQKKLKAEE